MTEALATAIEPEAAVDLRRLSTRDAQRLLEIVLVLARHGAFVVVRRGPYLVLRLRRRGPRALAVAVRRSFTDLGPTFVKLGQLIASSPGLFPPTLSQEFRRLLDQLPAEPAPAVRALIERELGAPIATLFGSFDDRPVAAASIAQVHRATLPDGSPVAVKVRRPRLARRIERDLRLLRLLAALLQHAGTAGDVANPAAIVDDFATTLRSELDFRNEAAAMIDFAALLARHDDANVTVPLPVDGMVSPRVLVMTFVDGTPVDDVDELRAQGQDLEQILRTAVQSWVRGALADGLFHGDVHAGNLFVLHGGQVAFLDWGIVGRLDEGMRAALVELIAAVLLEHDFAHAARIVFELGVATKPVQDLDRVARDFQALVEPLLSTRLADISYGEVLAQVIPLAGRYAVRLPRELVLVVKQLVYFERYAKQLAPNYQILADPGILSGVLATLYVNHQQ